jgi:hypothetical protein
MIKPLPAALHGRDQNRLLGASNKRWQLFIE